MHQIKIFKSIESDILEMEEQVNTWLSESGATVVNIFGNMSPQTMAGNEGAKGLGGRAFAPSDVFITVLYEK